MKVWELELESAEATQLLAEKLVKAAGSRALVLLKGPMGAGKTTFAQGAGKALGVTEVITSPTFTTLNEYHSGSAPFYHLDLYRLQDDAEGDSAAGLQFIEDELEEFERAPGFVLIEWPEVLNESLQTRDYVCVELNYSDSPDDNPAGTREASRRARISAHGNLSARTVETLANIYF